MSSPIAVHEKTFCLVYMHVLDAAQGKIQLNPVYGVAYWDGQALQVHSDNGHKVVVPESAYPSIQRCDGTEILKDREYFAIVKIAEG